MFMTYPILKKNWYLLKIYIVAAICAFLQRKVPGIWARRCDQGRIVTVDLGQSVSKLEFRPWRGFLPVDRLGRIAIGNTPACANDTMAQY